MRCVECDKEIETRDMFHLNPNDMIDPCTGNIRFIGNCFCLNCYMKKQNIVQKLKAWIMG